MTAFEVSKLVFLELAVILAACRVAGWLIRPLGWLAPQWQAALFPKPAVGALYCAAQVGLALHMFVVGLEFDADLTRKRVKSAVAVFWAGILGPLALGAALAWQFRGLISPLLFSILVVMAVVTTLMATPLFSRVYVRPAPQLVPAGAGLGVQP